MSQRDEARRTVTTFLTPVKIADGWYEGLWSGHTIKWRFENQDIQCETDRGVRGINVSVGFEVKDGNVVENTIRPVEQA